MERHRADTHNLGTQVIFEAPGWLTRNKDLVHHVCGHHDALHCSCSSRILRHEITNDLGDCLSTIREHYQQPIVNLLLDIQETKIQHLKSTEFMEALECLYFSGLNGVPDIGRRPTGLESAYQPITLRRRCINAFKKRDYVALSYTWGYPSPLNQPCGKYSVQSRHGNLFQSDVRDSVFERVWKYMIRFNLRNLWIDRHCIVQEDSKEKVTAIQAMDLVYSCSQHPIGLLYQPILSIADLKLLEGLMKGEYLDKNGSKFNLTATLPRESACKTLELLEAIVSDMWWTRAWTYQENYRGNTAMQLLIPHCISSEDYHNGYSRLFKDVPGEVVLNSTRFHEAATAFCLAFDPPNNLANAKKLVLERAGKYTLLLQESDPFGNNLARRSMSPSIVANIEKRQLSKPWDRLPIIANCCQYSVRLDDTELMKRGHSVSLAILALFLLNGEIPYNGRHHRTYASNTPNITNFLNEHAFRQFSPPQSAFGLTYNKCCRFIDTELTGEGVETRGHLWKLGRVIHASELFESHPDAHDNLFPGLNERQILSLLANRIGKLKYRKLSEDIRTCVKNYDSNKPKSFAKAYQGHMAEELATAIGKGRSIQLAGLWNPSDDYSPYCGIFICNNSEPNETLEYVFTASQEKAAGDDKSHPNDIDRHVSMEVDCDVNTGGLPFLRTRRWIHGLCFFYRCPRINVVFPWPTSVTKIQGSSCVATMI
ncbi:heterokaryon incompatibility protein-domain-containing protein [Xylaria telfairii]|nr:heterokaryon incompatibility protein-domain-containing protein [Xylaria telfairii]